MQPSRWPVARVLLAVGDGAAWVSGLGLATWVRYAFEETLISVPGLLIAIVAAVAAQRVIGTAAHTHRGRFMLGSPVPRSATLIALPLHHLITSKPTPTTGPRQPALNKS